MKFKRVALLLALALVLSCRLSFAELRHAGCIVVYGDSRTNRAAHQRVVDAIVKVKPQAVFNTGDLVENGNYEEQWLVFNKITRHLRKFARYYPMLGNHEENAKLYFANFVLPNNERWYSLEGNGMHFTVLDSESDIGLTSEQYRWLESDLKRVSRNIKFKIVLLHDPIFSTGEHGGEEKKLKGLLSPLFEKYGVAMVFSGHDHDYERSFYNNIYYIVTGGGGAPLYQQKTKSPYSQLFISTHHFCELCVAGNQLIVSVFDTGLNLIDQFSVKRK